MSKRSKHVSMYHPIMQYILFSCTIGKCLWKFSVGTAHTFLQNLTELSYQDVCKISIFQFTVKAQSACVSELLLDYSIMFLCVFFLLKDMHCTRVDTWQLFERLAKLKIQSH